MKPIFFIDGRGFRVGVTSLRRGAKITDGPNTLPVRSGRTVRDIVGTYYNYTLGLSTFDMERTEYDVLYEILTAPAESHSVTVPYGQGELPFEAYITEVEDTLESEDEDDSRSWGEMSVVFYAAEPQRRP